MDEAVVIDCIAGLHAWKRDDEVEAALPRFVSPFNFLVSSALPMIGPEVVALFAEEVQAESRKSWQEYWQWVESREEITKSAPLTARMVMLSIIGTERVYEAVFAVKTHLQLARAMLAVERFRLAYGALPENLEALVPEFLQEVPVDYFAENDAPLHYIPGEDSAFKIYSVGWNGRDDDGIENEKNRRTGDITFTVAPVSFREGPQIEE